MPDSDTPLLAIDTATPSCSVAIQHQGQRYQHIEYGARKHTQVILPMIDALFHEHGLTAQSLGGIVVSAGPGAFTGLRVGAAVALGIGCAYDIPLLAVSSLALLAASAARLQGNGRILALFDARMNQVYAGFYACCQGKIEPLGEDCLCNPEDIPATWLENADYLAGAGCIYPFFQDTGKSRYTDIQPHAQDGFDLCHHGQWQPAWEGLSLRYLRNNVVQIP